MYTLTVTKSYSMKDDVVHHLTYKCSAEVFNQALNGWIVDGWTVSMEAE